MRAGAVRRAARRLGPLWQVQRARRPGLTARAQDAVVAARGREALVADVRELRERLAGLERDHLLLAAHVAALTTRIDEAAGGADREAVDEDAAARDRARLGAIAFYEQRIAALEDRVETARHPRRDRPRTSSRRPSGERPGAAA